jgi:hypothetical protein
MHTRMAGRPDVAAAKALMSPSIGFWRDIADLENHLTPDEEVWRMAGGEYAGESGLVAVTDKRVLFLALGQIRWSVDTAKIGPARCDCGELFATLTITTKHGGFTVRRVDRRDGAAAAEAAGGRCSRGYRMGVTPTG